MSKLYAESRGEGSRDLFNKRVMYRRRVRNAAGNNRNIVDFTIGEKKLYGKVDMWHSPIYIKYDSRLRPIRGVDPQQSPKAFNFVADLFNEMILEFERCTINGQIDKTDPYLSSVVAHKAYTNPIFGYREYKEIFLKKVKSRFVKNNIMIEDFPHFLKEFMKIATTAFKSTPFTYAGYVKSDLNSIMSSGLAIEIADLDYNNDKEKVDVFMKSKNWPFFVNACNKYGFIIDHNIPWRIICDLKSPEIAFVRAKYYSSTQEVFDMGYTRASVESFVSLPRDLIELYNAVKRNRFKKQVICGKRVTHEVIRPPSYTVNEIVEQYGLDHFLKIYMKLRLLEEKPDMDVEKKKFLIRDTLEYVRLKGNYTYVETYFERFINKPFDKRYSHTYNKNVVMPARQKVMQEKRQAFSASEVKQAMTSY